jgi:outer membrane biosynthesis protein TonB
MVAIKRDAAITLFEALGITSASKWNVKRMAAKLAKVDEMVDVDTAIEDPNAEATLSACLGAITAGEEITVDTEAADTKTKAEATKAKASKKSKAKPKSKPEPKPKKKATATKPKPEPKKKGKGVTTKTKKVTPKPKKSPEPSSKGSATRGVRDGATRPFYAGKVIKAHGLENGVTESMVAALDKTFGRPNERQSFFILRNAWHAIRGYSE